MAWTQAQIDNMRDLIAQGIRTVTVNGRTVTYDSTADMQKALAAMEAEVNRPSVTRRPVVRRIQYGRG